MSELSDVDKALLDIEGKVWPQSGPKETAIREATGLTMVRAMQHLNQLIDTEQALAYAPLTVKRLLRLRDDRKIRRRRA